MKYHDAAGRTAYLAGFHAAQALISERTGRTVKTHRGVNTAFIGSSEMTRASMMHYVPSSASPTTSKRSLTMKQVPVLKCHRSWQQRPSKRASASSPRWPNCLKWAEPSQLKVPRFVFFPRPRLRGELLSCLDTVLRSSGQTPFVWPATRRSTPDSGILTTAGRGVICCIPGSNNHSCIRHMTA
jgi:hypothetical protein